MEFKLLSSPLQGFTDFRFRNAFHKNFGGIQTYFAPYIRLDGKKIIKPNYHLDLLPENNQTLEVIPQVMTNDADEFLFVVNYIQGLGYKELNWNLGCPYPMVVNRCMGSGLISEKEKIDHILNRVHSETDVTVSMKMRLGYLSPTEILDTIPVLDKYPLKNIAIHARIGQQLYKGGTDLDSFQKALESTKHLLYFNGDITSVEVFRALQNRFPTVKNWMIGRGILHDPFLASMIQENQTNYPKNALNSFKNYHEDLINAVEIRLKADKMVIMKMGSYWEYLEKGWLQEYQREIKKIRKSKTLEDYHDHYNHLLTNLE